MTQLLVLILLSLLCLLGVTKWTKPVKLLDINQRPIYIRSMYRDPAVGVNHVVTYRDAFVGQYLAVADNGTLLHTHVFGWARSAVIRGAGDGKRLFVALDYFDNKSVAYTVRFSESSDCGKTWTTPVSLFSDPKQQKNLQDMIYLAETGRIMVFFNPASQEQLRLTARSPGSVVFSESILVAEHADPFHAAKAAYVASAGKRWIHVAYLAETHIMYTRSETNGATWAVPRKICGDTVIDYITNMVVVAASRDSRVYILFRPRDTLPLKLLQSENGGTDFARPVNITKENAAPDLTYGGFAACGRDHLASMLLIERYSAEYAVWDHKMDKPEYRTHPFPATDLATAAIDCAVGVKRLVTSAFVTAWDGSHNFLYFAIDLEDANEIAT